MYVIFVVVVYIQGTVDLMGKRERSPVISFYQYQRKLHTVQYLHSVELLHGSILELF